MPSVPEPLSPEFAEALARVNLRRLGVPTLFFSTVGSTNDVASVLADSGDHEGAVVIAETQTAGRGTRGSRRTRDGTGSRHQVAKRLDRREEKTRRNPRRRSGDAVGRASAAIGGARIWVEYQPGRISGGSQRSCHLARVRAGTSD